ncbi:MAG: cytochrome P450 [Chloroflexi bacterium]|nr:cytochrome P450 [Chloroflexota bacterium]
MFERDAAPAGLREGVPFSQPLADRRFESPLIPAWLPVGARRGCGRAHSWAKRGDCRPWSRIGAAVSSNVCITSTRRRPSTKCCFLFHAGTELVANTLAWPLHLLACNPDAEAELLQEVRSTLGGRLPNAADLDNLPYAEMVIRETLRLYPPVWVITRQATRERGSASTSCRPAARSSSARTRCTITQAVHQPGSFYAGTFSAGYEKRLQLQLHAVRGGRARGAGRSFVTTVSTLLLAGIVGRWRLNP